MASGNSIGSKDHISEEKTRSILVGSEESFKFECDACKLDEQIREAVCFCIDCEDYLCNDCEQFHKRLKATRFHKILAGDNMPLKVSQKESSQLPAKRDLNYLFCSTCKDVIHKRCSTKTIEETIKDQSTVEDFKATLNQIDISIETA